MWSEILVFARHPVSLKSHAGYLYYLARSPPNCEK